MIKNWKLFLENNHEDDDFEKTLKRLGEDLKGGLYIAFSPIFIGEIFVRASGGSSKDLETGVEIIFSNVLNAFTDILENKDDLDEELKDNMIEFLHRSCESAKTTMTEKSFKAGISHMVDIFVNFLIDYKKAVDSEGEEWKEEKVKDYSDLSKSEINNLIDQALDARDFEKVKFLSQYLKESYEQEVMSQIEEACRKAAELLVQFCISVFKV